MNRVGFGEGACEKTRRYLDAYLSSELLVETNHEVLRHLESCAACTLELEMRTRLRTRLKSAVQAQVMPPGMPALVREHIRSRESSRWFSLPPWQACAIAAAFVLVIGAATWIRPGSAPLPDVADRAAQATYIQKVSATVASVFQPGLGDHIHCAIFRKYPQNAPSAQEMESKLGDEFKGLLALVAPAVPKGYQVVMAHQCTYAGRKFVHLTMRKGTDVISLVISRKKEGESFAVLSPATSASGVPVYQSSTSNYQVAGFEGDRYLAFVVSDLKGRANLELAETLAPAVHRMLS